MARAQKPDLVFQRSGRVHLNWWGRQFSRLLAGELCPSLLGLYCSCEPVFCSHVTHTGYPLHSLVSPSLLLPCVTVCHHISNAVYSRLGGPQGRSGQMRKISPPTGFDPRTVQPVATRPTRGTLRKGWFVLRRGYKYSRWMFMMIILLLFCLPTAPDGRTMNWEACGKNRSWPTSSNCFCIRTEGLRKTKNALNQDNRRTLRHTAVQAGSFTAADILLGLIRRWRTAACQPVTESSVTAPGT
jgi:hypothetical protein